MCVLSCSDIFSHFLIDKMQESIYLLGAIHLTTHYERTTIYIYVFSTNNRQIVTLFLSLLLLRCFLRSHCCSSDEWNHCGCFFLFSLKIFREKKTVETRIVWHYNNKNILNANGLHVRSGCAMKCTKNFCYCCSVVIIKGNMVQCILVDMTRHMSY